MWKFIQKLFGKKEVVKEAGTSVPVFSIQEDPRLTQALQRGADLIAKIQQDKLNYQAWVENNRRLFTA